jgi:hypothetical protein
MWFNFYFSNDEWYWTTFHRLTSQFSQSLCLQTLSLYILDPSSSGIEFENSFYMPVACVFTAVSFKGQTFLKR